MLWAELRLIRERRRDRPGGGYRLKVTYKHIPEGKAGLSGTTGLKMVHRNPEGSRALGGWTSQSFQGTSVCQHLLEEDVGTRRLQQDWWKSCARGLLPCSPSAPTTAPTQRADGLPRRRGPVCLLALTPWAALTSEGPDEVRPAFKFP